MPDISYLILQCAEQGCRFRFPKIDDSFHSNPCPVCGSATRIVVSSFQNRSIPCVPQPHFAYSIHGLLDNLRSAYNVGSIFRSADGAGVAHLYLCGITPTPDNPRTTKTALGAESSIPWSRHNNALDTAQMLQDAGYTLIALEGGNSGTSFDLAGDGLRSAPIVLIVGSELSGVDPELIDICDHVWSLPMIGVKTSLNVTVAFGIAVYCLQFYSTDGLSSDVLSSDVLSSDVLASTSSDRR
jgi:tRNA G18 (ribose-2'-O)-methylase SpoU